MLTPDWLIHLSVCLQDDPEEWRGHPPSPSSPRPGAPSVVQSGGCKEQSGRLVGLDQRAARPWVTSLHSTNTVWEFNLSCKRVVVLSNDEKTPVNHIWGRKTRPNASAGLSAGPKTADGAGSVIHACAISFYIMFFIKFKFSTAHEDLNISNPAKTQKPRGDIYCTGVNRVTWSC